MAINPAVLSFSITHRLRRTIVRCRNHLRLCLVAALVAVPCVAQSQAQELGIIATSDISFTADGGDVATEGQPKMSISFGNADGMMSFGSPMADPNNSSALTGLLQQDKIRSELKITPEQIAGIEKLQKKSNQLLSSAVQAMMKARSNGGGNLDLSTLQEAKDNVRDLTDRGIEEILLPEQFERIRQIAFQVEISRMGLGPSLTRGKLGESVGVRNEQKPDLIRLATKIEEETTAKIAQIRREAREELVATLDEDQQAKVIELIGDYFDYSAPTMDDMMKQVTKRFKPKAEETKQEPATPK